MPVQPAGAGRYIFELAKGLAKQVDMHTVLFARSDDAFRWEALGDNIAVDAVAPRARPARLLWEQVRLPSLLKRAGVNVHHAPHYTMPEHAKAPVVVTIHDMTLFDNPQWHERTKVLLFQRAITVAVKRASRLIAVSNDTAMRVKERFGDMNITVIPHGIDHQRFHAYAPAGERAELTAKGMPDEYIAFVGTIEPRKNVPQLIRAFDALAHKYPSLHLVIAGQRGWALEEFDTTLAGSPHRSRILTPGYLSEPLVPAVLRHARVVAYPSHVEGFGLPALEALACGAPLVASTGSAVEEVVGDAGILVDPNDVAALAYGLEEALAIDRAHALQKGTHVASRFTWQAAVKAHVDVYRQASS